MLPLKSTSPKQPPRVSWNSMIVFGAAFPAWVTLLKHTGLKEPMLGEKWFALSILGRCSF